MKDYIAYILDTEFGVAPKIEKDGSKYYLHFDDAEIHGIVLANFEVINAYFYSMGFAYQIIDPEDEARDRQVDNKMLCIEETRSITRQPLLLNASTEKIDTGLTYASSRLDALCIDRDTYIEKIAPTNLPELLSSLDALPKRLTFEDFDATLAFSVSSHNASCCITAQHPKGVMTVLYMKPKRVYISHRKACHSSFPDQRFWGRFLALFDDFFVSFAEDDLDVTVSYSTDKGKTLSHLRQKYPDAQSYLQLDVTGQSRSVIKAVIIDDKISLRGTQRYVGKIHDVGVQINDFLRGMQGIHFIE